MPLSRFPLLHRVFLRRWHRRLGIVSAAFVIVLAATGLLLNHTQELGLDDIPLENRLLRALYGVPAVAPEFPLSCPRPVTVVAAIDAPLQLAACDDRIALLTADNEIVDQLDTARGLPGGITAIASDRDGFLLQRGAMAFRLDNDNFTVTPLAIAPADVAWRSGAAAGTDIHWERVLLDLHSGRLFGTAGVIIVDVAALLFVVLAISGIVMFRRRD
ncbi:MAG: PepSY-associated TM helix domain-containing protein [Gammaproteobacteria bacterium]